MLSQTLRTLEADGFILRYDYQEVPPRVEYSLTPLGRDAAEHVELIGKWVAANTPHVLAARQKYRRSER
jgi:DNA-binding HxlR family transcriptional regulator